MNYSNTILKWYRYISLFLTTSVYIFTREQRVSLLEWSIVIGLVSGAYLVTYLIEKSESELHMMLIILVEMLGNSIILYASGGIESPYVWYCFNTVLLAALKLRESWAVAIGSVYVLVNITLSIIGIQFIQHKDIGDYKIFVSNSLLGEFIIILACMLVCYLYKQNEEKTKAYKLANKELEKQRMKTEETLIDVTQMYHMVNWIVLETDAKQIVKAFLGYMEEFKLAKSSLILLLDNERHIADAIHYRIKNTDGLIQQVQGYLANTIEEGIFVYQDTCYIMREIRYANKMYGILVFKAKELDEQEQYKLDFILKLLSILLKKTELEEMSQGIITSEEQNRIANEIHDSVIQKLFSITCTMKIQEEVLKKKNDSTAVIMREMRKDLQNTMQELREAIYNLSWEKKDASFFIQKMQDYITFMQQYNDIEIFLHIEGSPEHLAYQQKIAFYRIVCELINNNIKHGKATQIEIKMVITVQHKRLEVKSNGENFDYKWVLAEKKGGLGIRNIIRLVELLGGTLESDTKKVGETQMVIQIGKE